MATLDTSTIIIDQTGTLAYLSPTTLEVYDNTGPDVGISGIFSSGESDLGEPSVDKLVNYIDVDYVGKFNIWFKLDDMSTSVITVDTKATRGTAWIYLPLVERKAFQKLQYWIDGPTHGTEIYGIEIDFSILKRRRYN